MKSAVTAALACGALPVLAASAILVSMAPTVQTWIVVLALSVVAGLCSAWSGYERHRLLVSLQTRIDAGAQTARTALAETTAARTEADKLLVDSFERCFAEYGRRDEQSRSTALTKLTTEVAVLLREYRDTHDREAKSRAAALDGELAKVRETFAVAGQTIENAIADWRKTTAEVERISKRLVAELQEHVTNTLSAVLNTWTSGAELRANEILAEMKRSRVEYEELSRAAGENLRSHTVAIAEHQQYLDDQRAAEGELRNAVLADWARAAKEANNSIRDVVSDLGARLERILVEERNRREEQRQAERGRFERMLEDQRKAYDDAAAGSAQLWDHMLAQLDK